MKRILLSLTLLICVIGTSAQNYVQIANIDCNRVLYADYNNQLLISVPGIEFSQLKLSSSEHMRITAKEDGTWILVPQSNQKQVTIKVEAEVNGKIVELAQHQFEVRMLPYPQVYLILADKRVSQEEGHLIRVSRYTLTHEKSVLGVDFGDVPILYDWAIRSFILEIESSIFECEGKELSTEAIQFINAFDDANKLTIKEVRAVDPNGRIVILPSLDVIMY